MFPLKNRCSQAKILKHLLPIYSRWFRLETFFIVKIAGGEADYCFSVLVLQKGVKHHML